MVMSADGGSAAAASAAAASSSSFSRGHLILKSHKPLPRFACAIPVPHPDTSIQQLRSTIVAILIGQVSAAKHDKNGANSSSSTSTNKRGQINYYSGQKSEDTGLSYSEHLKQLTIQEWRMKSLVLELRQNALIAPETREAAAASAITDDDEEEDGNGDKNGAAGRGEVEESISGFELQDEHECALLEHGDEVNLWLKPGQELDSLRLPKLSSKHAYGLPNQPALDRSGMILLGSDQTQQQSSNDFAFTSPALAVREPAEPSSHSSSVSAHPDVQFETTARHWAPPSQQHRVVVVGNGIRNNSMPGSRDDGNNNRLLTPQTAAVTPAAPLVAAKKEKPRRLNSMDYFSSQLVDPKAQEKKQRESYTHHHRSNSGPIRVVSSGSGAAAAAGVTGGDSSPVPSSSLIASPPLAGAESRRPSAQPISSPATAAMPPLSSPPAVSTNDAIAAQLKARQAAMIRAEREKEKERSNRISMKKMPSEALIVGPGVQGKFGRMASYDNYKGTSAEKSYNSTSGGGGGGGGRGDDLSNNGAGGGGGNGDTFGNLDAFVSFTAASSEAHGQVRPHVGRMRRPSNRSGASDKERFEIEAAKRPGDRRRQSSSKAERKPSFQSGSRRSAAAAAASTATGTTSSPALELLPPMPMPRPVNESTSPSGSWQDVLQAMSDSPVIVDDATLMSPRDGTVGRGDIGSPSAVDEEEEDERLAELAAPGMVLTSSSSASQPQTSSLSSSLPPPSSPGGEPGEAGNKTDIQASHQTTAKAAPLTKAERRYMEVMKDLEAERERQRQDEKMRREAVIKREEEKARALAKLQEEERRKKEIEKWQVWEEVKARQAKEKERGYQYNTKGGVGGREGGVEKERKQ